jgi:hypothetical protein
VAKKIYILYCRKAVDWEEEFRFHASGIEEAKSFAYAWAVREGISKDYVGVKEHTGSTNYPILVIRVPPKRFCKIASERISA